MRLKGKLFIFISNFLSDREFNVRVNSTYSDIQEQEIGVPQGSILSVTLLGIQINSLAKVLNDNIEGSLYVDKGNNKITELRTILHRESQNS